MTITSFKLATPAFLLLAILFTAQAQKLPTKQETGLRAPADIKTDGKATEWNNQYQAYNKSTEIFYTIANDDDNLYLVIHAVKPVVIQKILSHRLVFSLQNAIKKANNQDVAITYPLLKTQAVQNILHSLKAKLADAIKDAAENEKHRDSLVNLMNNQFSDQSKEIIVSGIKDVSDTLSVYNETGIKVAALFDNDRGYTYELAVPLKYLGLSVNGPSSFSYNIKLNGAATNNLTVRQSADGRYTIRSSTNGRGMSVETTTTSESLTLDYPIDFGGEYTLAKK